MEAQNVERRSAAIVAADVVGYSRLMEVDEEGTLARMKTVRLELIDPAIAWAMRLNPYHPERFWSHLGRAQYTARAYADAMASFSKMTAPDYAHHAFLAASSAQLGDRTAASAHAREVLAREPSFTARTFLATLQYRQPSDAEHVRQGLVKAGLPE